MNKVVETKAAPAPIGPYSQAVWAGGILYLSGQVCLNPQTGVLQNESIEAECLQVMKNLEAVLQEAALNFTHVVKTSIFLSDMAHFSAVNTVYSSFFSGSFPARETVAVKGLPRDVNVEISMIAFAG